MDNPRPEKVAVVDEVRARLDDAQATVVTEYRGLTVANLAALRKSLTAAGGDYKVFKNTLVKRAINGGPYAPLGELLVGPTAIAFVHGDVSAVAKALRDFARTNTHLVVKGGMLDGAPVSPAQLGALADLPSREVLLARIAGAFQAPLSQLASLLQALPRNLAYGLKALVDERGGVPAAAPEAEAPEAATLEAEAPEAAAQDTAETVEAVETAEAGEAAPAAAREESAPAPDESAAPDEAAAPEEAAAQEAAAQEPATPEDAASEAERAKASTEGEEPSA
jgi:large subunit ribosomal protein L10